VSFGVASYRQELTWKALAPHGEGKSLSEGGRLPAMTTPAQVLQHPCGYSQTRAAWKLARYAEPEGPREHWPPALKTQLPQRGNRHVTLTGFRRSDARSGSAREAVKSTCLSPDRKIDAKTKN
jgi:hypothetical protein